MNDRTVKLGRAIALSILFIVTVFSLPGGQRGVSSAWNTVHIWSGSLLLIGAGVHLVENRRWVRAVFSRSRQNFKPHVRRLRNTNLGLFICAGLCSTAGAVWLLPWLSPAWIERSANLHQVSGILMIAVLVAHLLLHWGWLVKTVRGLSGKRSGARRYDDAQISP